MSTTVPPPHDAYAPTEELRSAAPIPRLADGVELIGRFEDSGFKEPPCIARRADGQVVQMAPLLFALADEIDGRRSYDDVAEALSHRIERGVTGEMVEMLVQEQLKPLGIVAGEQQLKKVDPLLALKFRTKVVPARITSALTTVFRPLFFGPVVVAVVAAFVALDGWLLGVHGVSQSLRHVIYNPALLVLLIGGVVLATAFHEIGHATALRYGGGKPGVMGVGVYIVWPAFYTDITDSYRLDKRGRLRTDLGGMYFNAVFALVIGAVYALTGFEPLLLLVLLQTFAIIQQSLPLLRLDGYYIISDLTGVPDILTRMRPILASLLPWRDADERVTELKPWVRVVVTAYVCLIVPVIAFIFLALLINAPRLFATGWDSFWLQWDRVGPYLDGGQAGRGFVSIFQMVVLVLPLAGLTYTFTRVSHRFGTAGWRWSAGSALRRGVLAAGVAAAVGLAAFLLWPQPGEYRPIQPGERGTLFGALKQMRHVPSGRPALTPERSYELGGAPSERELQRDGRKREPVDSAPTTGTGAPDGDASGARQSTDPTGSTATDTPSGEDGEFEVAPAPEEPEAGAPPPEEPTTQPQPAAPPPTATQPEAAPAPDDTTTTDPSAPEGGTTQPSEPNSTLTEEP
jgi:putative peptide zinc metalloprotease protein